MHELHTEPVLCGGRHVEWITEDKNEMFFPLSDQGNTPSKSRRSSLFNTASTNDDSIPRHHIKIRVLDFEVGNNDRLIGEVTLSLLPVLVQPETVFLFKAVLKVNFKIFRFFFSFLFFCCIFTRKLITNSDTHTHYKFET